MTDHPNAITDITRRKILNYMRWREVERTWQGAVFSVSVPFHGRIGVMDFLERAFPLRSMPSPLPAFQSAYDAIAHLIRANRDRDPLTIVEGRLDLLHCADALFLKFLAETLHPMVNSDEESNRNAVSYYSKLLALDGYRLLPSTQVSGHTVYSSEQIGQYRYALALTYAGEDRGYVEEFALLASGKGIRIFFAPFKEGKLWGKDLVDEFDRVFRKDARFCVMFISNYYAIKAWPTFERRTAFARMVEQRSEYILPARFDGTEIPGLRPTIAYIDLKTTTPEQLVELALEKLSGTNGEPMV